MLLETSQEAMLHYYPITNRRSKAMNYKSCFAVTVSAITLVTLSPEMALAQQSAEIGQIENFIRNIIQAVAGLSGLVATGFFIIGGYGYITSSGSPELLERSKRTLVYSSAGLAITTGAFALSNIVTNIANNSFGA